MIGRILGWFTGNLGAYIAGGLLLAGVSAWGVQTWRLHSAETALATKEASWATERAQASEAAASASSAYRLKEQDWAKSREEIINAAIKNTEAAASAVAAADSAAGRLRDRIAAVAAAGRRASGNSATARPGAPASAPSDLLADVSRRLEEAVRGVGGFAEASNIAGIACERSYDKVSK